MSDLSANVAKTAVVGGVQSLKFIDSEFISEGERVDVFKVPSRDFKTLLTL